MSSVTVSRRFFLSASIAAGGGLLFGYSLISADAASQENSFTSDIPLNAWIRISTNDEVTLISSQSEMGQGIMTTLPAVLAEELGADWSRVKIEDSIVAPAYRNPRINWLFTGNSESTTGYFELMRTMGASAREMLISAAAKRWSAKAEECYAENGRIIHRPSSRTFKFGEVAEDAAKVTPPQNLKLKPESEWRLLGRSLPRVELKSKIDGTAIFGLDFSVPGLVHAAVMHNPVHGGTVATFDKESVAKLPGILDVVPIPNAVAVVAKQYWQARQALKSLKVDYDGGPNAGVSSDSLMKQYRAALDGNEWKPVRTVGDALRAEDIEKFSDVISQEYESQFMAHATMEPMNCTAHVTEDSCTVWGPLQGPELAKLALSGLLKLPPEKVSINRTLLGGGFGRRLLVDFVVQAALISKAVGKPVNHIAHVVELSVKNNLVKIHRIVCVIDCGVALDPEICKNSIEGGTVWGLGVAFKSKISFTDGRTDQTNFHDFLIPQMNETPPIEVHIVNSSIRGMGGTGEVGPVTLVPAVVNALFAATGKRYRSLPLTKQGLTLA